MDFLTLKNGKTIELIKYDEVGSTNDLAKDLALVSKKDAAIVAYSQTKGRGTKGRTFYSPEGTGLYLSLLLHPDFSPEDALKITTSAAVAVSLAIEKLAGKSASIKWVNDILIDNKKVCGILTEGSLSSDGKFDYAILGIGINVFEPKGGFPDEIKDIAGSVFSNYDMTSISSADEVRNKLLEEVILNFFQIYDDINSFDILEEYKSRCDFIGKEIKITKPGYDPVFAKACGIDNNYSLVVEYEDGWSEALNSAEISIRLN